MNKLQRMLAWFLIPRGFYCKGCPFWFKDGSRREQENGYCSYLGKGDWDINDEYPQLVEVKKRKADGSYKTEFVNKSELLPMSLLWDGCKECEKR